MVAGDALGGAAISGSGPPGWRRSDDVGDVHQDVDDDEHDQQAAADDRDPPHVAPDVAVLLRRARGERARRVDRRVVGRRLRPAVAALAGLRGTSPRRGSAASSSAARASSSAVTASRRAGRRARGAGGRSLKGSSLARSGRRSGAFRHRVSGCLRVFAVAARSRAEDSIGPSRRAARQSGVKCHLLDSGDRRAPRSAVFGGPSHRPQRLSRPYVGVPSSRSASRSSSSLVLRHRPGAPDLAARPAARRDDPGRRRAQPRGRPRRPPRQGLRGRPRASTTCRRDPRCSRRAGGARSSGSASSGSTRSRTPAATRASPSP